MAVDSLDTEVGAEVVDSVVDTVDVVAASLKPKIHDISAHKALPNRVLSY